MNATQLRETILAADDRPTRTLAVPEWDCTIKVGTLSAAEREAMEEAQDKGRWRERLVAATAVDDAGQRVFTAADVAALSGKSAAVVARLAKVAIDLNGLGPAAAETAKNA